MRIPSHRLNAAAALALLALGSATACGEDKPSTSADDPSSGASPSAYDGPPCPERLPAGTDPGYGLGTREAARSRPSLPPIDEAWVCEYQSVDVRSDDDSGASFRWDRARQAVPVPAAQLAGLGESLGGLAPPDDGERMCTADLGPRWLLSYVHGDGLIGVVVDDYGCREVRLTDDPFETVPGESAGAGTVRGVLTAPAELLVDLKAVAGQ